MSERPLAEQTAGRSLVTRRAIRDIVRASVTASYGITGLGARGVRARVMAAVGRGEPGVEIRIAPDLVITVRVQVARGLPVAEVARQVDSAVRYELGRAIGREPDRVVIHVDGFGVVPTSVPRKDRDAPSTGGSAASRDGRSRDGRPGDGSPGDQFGGSRIP